MFSTLRNRFGIPGVISVIALVFAMFGGAYAASNSSGGGKATASAKAKKGPRGPKGATGPAGPAGAQGPVGPAGAKGDNGVSGANGAAGAPGASVTSEEFAGSKEGHCSEGGTKFTTGATKTFACNGEAGTPGNNGAPGAPGSPWTAGGTLPVGSTETGAYSFSGPKGEYGEGLNAPVAPISFPIPLAAPTEAAKQIYVSSSEPNPDPAHCPGSSANPEAASGYLCVYEEGASGIELPFILLAGVAGGGVYFLGAEQAKTMPPTVHGSWAVTG
jgi:Collagen triple helix repeat (20 copies)